MQPAADEFVVDFPTLGFLAADWIAAHCLVPDGFTKGAPFVMYDWQLWCCVNHYRVKPGAKVGQLAPAFHYRRSQIVAPQKALALDTPVPTPSGWSTMADLRVGDEVFDEAGRPTAVLSKSPVWHSDTYRVSFSDGASLVACKDHEWWVERRTPSGTYVPDRVRTEDLVGNLVDRHGARRFRVPNAKPLDLPDVDLPIDPYTLGAWLGDGNRDDGRLTGIDRPVFDRIAAAGYEVRQMKVAKRVNVIGLKSRLRSLGVLRNKHVPAAYLRASAAQRWALLQGLMDTDGYADARQGKCEFTTTLPALRDGVLELLRSLGVRPVCYDGEAALYGRVTGPKWRVSFAARSDMPVFGLDRKQARLKTPGRGHEQHGHRRIVAVERVETVPTQCLAVAAESHVFLAGRDMVPTCNTGKGPWSAAITLFEAAGPAVFDGWAEGGEVYDCSAEHDGCGFVYVYEPGEPMGTPWPSPLIQLLATSEDQVDNVYRPLQAMVKGGPLSGSMKVGEEFTRIGDEGRIDVVTSSATARLGNPITFAIQDETGLYTKANKMVRVAETQRRGAAGMGGRTLETTNCWDPAEDSVAQRTAESRAADIFRFHRVPPAGLSYRNKAERARIHRFVYRGSTHVDLDAIEAEAAEILEKDPAQAERFFGNRVVHGLGSWLPDGLWESREQVREVEPGTPVALGFDGSDSDDWTAIRLCTLDGYRFTPTYGPDARPTIWNPAEWGGTIPRAEVNAAVDELCARYRVVLAYCDQRDWQSEIGDWAAEFGEKVFVEWATYRVVQMFDALDRSVADLVSGRSTHDDCPITAAHVANARKLARPGQRYILGKPEQHQKIDVAMADVLAYEAASVAEPPKPTRPRGMVVM